MFNGYHSSRPPLIVTLLIVLSPSNSYHPLCLWYQYYRYQLSTTETQLRDHQGKLSESLARIDELVAQSSLTQQELTRKEVLIQKVWRSIHSYSLRYYSLTYLRTHPLTVARRKIAVGYDRQTTDTTATNWCCEDRTKGYSDDEGASKWATKWNNERDNEWGKE